MDRREMEYLIVIAQEKNLSKAAERLYISQPALSRFLKKQEQEIGMSLFERQKKQLIPTTAGELYLDTARKVVQLEKDLECKIKKLQENPFGKLRIGITPGRAHSVLPEVLPVFQNVFPDYELLIREEDVVTLEKELDAGAVDVCFFAMMEDDLCKQSRYRFELIAQEDIVLCTPRSSRYELLAEERTGRKYPWIDLKYLENDCFILLKPGMRTGQQGRKILEEYEISPKIVELSSIDTALALVAQQYGVTFTSDYRLDRREIAKDIDIFTFGRQKVCWDFVAVYGNEVQLSAPARYMIELMRELY